MGHQTVSEEYKLKFPHLAAWITHLIAEGILKAVLLEPPCTTFSVTRRPPLRDKIHPFGFDISDRQTEDGNILAHRSFQIGYIAAANGAIAIIEKPHSCKMKYLPAWGPLLQLAGATLVRAGSCQFLSIHQKSFVFLGINVDLEPLALRCTYPCKETPATYVPKLACGLAHCIAQGVFQMRQHAKAASDVKVEGLENQLVNEVMLTTEWEVVKAWNFHWGRVLFPGAILLLCCWTAA